MSTPTPRTYNDEELTQTLNAAVTAVTELRVSDTQVRQDVQDYLMEMFTNEKQRPALERLLELVDTLGENFANVSLRETTLIQFLLRQLDLPRLQDEGKQIALQFNDVLGRDDLPQTSVVANTLALSELTAPALWLNESSDTLKGWALLQLDALKWVIFNFGGGVQAYEVTLINDGADLLINVKDDTYTAEVLGQQLTQAKPEYQPALMSEREEVVIEEIDGDFTYGFLRRNPDLVSASADYIIDVMLKDHATRNNTDYSDKRIALPHLNDVHVAIEKAVGDLRRDADQKTEVVPGTPVEPEVPLVETEDVEDGDDSLFKSGVTEQTEKTVAPTQAVATDIEYEDGDDEPVFSGALTRVRTILTELGEQPLSTNHLLSSGRQGIKATIYREVFNRLSKLENRSVESYTDAEVAAIKTHTDADLMAMLHLLRDHKRESEAEAKAPARYDVSEAQAVISADPLHESFLVKTNRVQDVASQVVQYLNNNEADISDDAGERRERILEVLLSICMYDYETEALINPDFVRSRLPNDSRLIADTKPIARAIKRFYTARPEPISEVSDDLLTKINRVFASKDHHFLDFSNTDAVTLLNGIVDMGQFVKLDRYLVVRSKGRGHIVMIMDAAKAYILYFKGEGLSSEQRISAPEHRALLLQALVNQ